MSFRSAPTCGETAEVRALLPGLDPAARATALLTARHLVEGARRRADERPYLDAFLQEFGLSNQEGIALMCLAEALLRIPDDETADRLIAEKIAAGNWEAHAGQSGSLFVNASTWGLMLTGRLVELPEQIRRDTGGWLRSLRQQVTEPLLRQALRRAMQIIGSEFVVGRDIGEALARARKETSLALCSFDMLGEGARTDTDAERYMQAYAQAIDAIGASSMSGRAARGTVAALLERHTISIKLSALDPRYSLAHRDRVLARLLPRVLELARLAARCNVALTIDAEEQDRLELSLELIESLLQDRELAHWPGLGLAVQAYGRRAGAVLEHVIALAQTHARPIAIRLVKGAYWDAEIKRAQERGLDEYPVFTRKASTDLAYLSCAKKLLAAGELVYPQFATHNAHTIAAVLALRGQRAAPCEFQRLHGMGALLYAEARKQIEDFPPIRTYAPVGPHEDLLAYLVRRLLENGANTSFVNRFMDERVPVAEVIDDPLALVETTLAERGELAHPHIPLPPALFGPARKNSRGLDFGRHDTLEHYRHMLATSFAMPAPPPFASRETLQTAMDTLAAASARWASRPVSERALILQRSADLLEAERDRFIALLVREAGKTVADGLAEVREAADFCRYYAQAAPELQGEAQRLPGPTGEINELSFAPRGLFACISPWNFPLAIFTGQIVAALVTGNTVIAKPAESTPQVALAMADLLHRAGIPGDALQVLPMVGRNFGDTALAHPALAGVVFTGSTRTALWLNRALAAREGSILPLIAETGGINAMIVDSSALPEQVIDDVIASAFGSAGQRCSALRLLCLQEDSAERILDMLKGAMDTLVIGDPAQLDTDVGPVITSAAAQQLRAHIEGLLTRGALLLKSTALPSDAALERIQAEAGIEPARFVAPHLLELRSVTDLREEAFGPILHVVRYRTEELDALLEQIHDNGYGLTLGIQTRLEGTRARCFAQSRAGNVYVNRNMIGAVVGVQPFGGSGLSGTGPKAGGPHYLQRFVTERCLTVNTAATGGNTELLSLD